VSRLNCGDPMSRNTLEKGQASPPREESQSQFPTTSRVSSLLRHLIFLTERSQILCNCDATRQEGTGTFPPRSQSRHSSYAELHTSFQRKISFFHRQYKCAPHSRGRKKLAGPSMPSRIKAVNDRKTWKNSNTRQSASFSNIFRSV